MLRPGPNGEDHCNGPGLLTAFMFLPKSEKNKIKYKLIRCELKSNNFVLQNFPSKSRQTLGSRSICRNVLLKIWISLSGKCVRVGGHHHGYCLRLHCASTKKARGFPDLLLCAGFRRCLVIITNLRWTGCDQRLELSNPAKTFPWSVDRSFHSFRTCIISLSWC